MPKINQVSKVYDLGFRLVKFYDHDDFFTNRYQKGIIQLEFTYENNTQKHVSTDICIEEVVGLEVSLSELKILDTILNKNTMNRTGEDYIETQLNRFLAAKQALLKDDENYAKHEDKRQTLLGYYKERIESYEKQLEKIRGKSVNDITVNDPEYITF